MSISEILNGRPGYDSLYNDELVTFIVALIPKDAVVVLNAFDNLLIVTDRYFTGLEIEDRIVNMGVWIEGGTRIRAAVYKTNEKLGFDTVVNLKPVNENTNLEYRDVASVKSPDLVLGDAFDEMMDSIENFRIRNNWSAEMKPQ